MKFVVNILKEVWNRKRLIFDLAKDDFKLRFAGSGLGVIWGFVQPFVTILLYWFVFQVGFRSGNVSNGMPYILWLIAGIVPWFFFNEAWVGASNCLYEYSFLVKKVVFKIEILPFVKILSALFVHIFFVDLIFIIFASYGYHVSPYNLQIIYYLICVLVLIYALSLITSSLVIFIKDIIQVIGILTQIFFWTIPIVWSPENINNRVLLNILKLNPIYYVVEGYRDSLVSHIWFWEKPVYTVYFWVVVTILLAIGVWIYKKLNRHFADLL